MASHPTQAFDLDRIGGRKAFAELIDEVLACGEDALGLYRAGAAKRTQKKPDRSPVTEADKAIEERRRAFLSRKFPQAGFLGEESGSAKGSGQELRFVLDPIDGTRAFIRGIPTWSILLGLEYQGDAVLGVAYQPATGDLFTAVTGDGAYGNGRPMHVSNNASLEDALIAHGALAQFTESGFTDWMKRLAECSYSQRGMHDFEGYRNMLLGSADAMVDPGVMPWDVCAPAVLIREAGGSITGLHGQSSIYEGGVIASNGHLHNALIKALSA
ncbi:MAG: histidinol phosphate phosphatase [Myxococcales bacterium]|nr:MAG: histidinol phosphate phosphatase [Myxococcales bacterium]